MSESTKEVTWNHSNLLGVWKHDKSKILEMSIWKAGGDYSELEYSKFLDLLRRQNRYWFTLDYVKYS